MKGEGKGEGRREERERSARSARSARSEECKERGVQGVTCEVSKAMTPVGLGEGEARARLLGWATVRAQAVGRGVCACVRSVAPLVA